MTGWGPTTKLVKSFNRRLTGQSEKKTLAAIHRVLMAAMVKTTAHLLDGLCRACTAHTDIIIELVSEGVIDNAQVQQSTPPEHWRFTGLHLHRAKIAVRLQRDLGVNFAGTALAFQLLDELDMLRARIQASAT